MNCGCLQGVTKVLRSRSSTFLSLHHMQSLSIYSTSGVVVVGGGVVEPSVITPFVVVVAGEVVVDGFAGSVLVVTGGFGGSVSLSLQFGMPTSPTSKPIRRHPVLLLHTLKACKSKKTDTLLRKP